jgi:hypothetical protein
MKIESQKIQFQKIDDHVSLIYHNGKPIQFWTPELRVPFGIDENFGKYYIRLEIHQETKQHEMLKKILEKVESVVIKRLQLEEQELKTIFRRKIGDHDLLDVRLKEIKGHNQTTCEYENARDNYLKTVFDIEKESYVKVFLEIHGIWDYREGNENTKKEKDNRVGLIVNALKIKVMEKKDLRNNLPEFIIG